MRTWRRRRRLPCVSGLWWRKDVADGLFQHNCWISIEPVEGGPEGVRRLRPYRRGVNAVQSSWRFAAVRLPQQWQDQAARKQSDAGPQRQ